MADELKAYKTCAKEGCNNLSYTGNAMVLPSPVGTVWVFLCSDHFSELLQINIASQSKENQLCSHY